MELEWGYHTNGANSGIFRCLSVVREPQMTFRPQGQSGQPRPSDPTECRLVNQAETRVAWRVERREQVIAVFG